MVFLFLIGYADKVVIPKWINSTVAYSYVGISSATPQEAINRAKKEAYNNALSLINNQLGVEVVSSSTLAQKEDDSGYTSSMQNQTKQQSSHNLQGIQITQQFIKKLDDGKIIYYVLIKMDKGSFGKLKDKILKSEADFKLLLDGIEKDILAKDEAQAYIKLAKAQDNPNGKNSKRLALLKKRLSNMMVVKVQGIDKEVKPFSNIQFSVTSNQKVFLYVFFNDGEKLIQVIPNEIDNYNEINKKGTFYFPSNKMNKNDYSIHYSSALRQSIVFITTKVPLYFSYKSSNNMFYQLDNSADATWKKKVQDKVELGLADMQTINLSVKKDIKAKNLVCIKSIPTRKLIVDSDIYFTVMQKLKEKFKINGYKLLHKDDCKKADYIVKLRIYKKDYYNEYIDEEAIHIKIKYNIYDANTTIELAHYDPEFYYSYAGDDEIAESLEDENLPVLLDLK